MMFAQKIVKAIRTRSKEVASLEAVGQEIWIMHESGIVHAYYACTMSVTHA